MREEEFLGRIARRLGRAKPQELPPVRSEQGVPAQLRRASQPLAERTAEFAANVERQGGVARVFPTREALRQGLVLYVAELRPQSLVAADAGVIAGESLQELLASYESYFVQQSDRVAGVHPAEQRARLAHADVAITGCMAAIADTGTLLLCHGPTHPRALSLLPTVHIVLLQATQIVANLGDALTLLDSATLPANALFMSGPSRSSDIENDLTIGVHGPAVVAAFICAEND